jgi:hypothetical protein
LIGLTVANVRLSFQILVVRVRHQVLCVLCVLLLQACCVTRTTRQQTPLL